MMDSTRAAEAWIPDSVGEPGFGFLRRRPGIVALTLLALAGGLMVWGATLFYGEGVGLSATGGHAVGGMESFAVLIAVPGQVIAALLMWLAVRSYIRQPPRIWLVVTLLLAGHVASIAMSAVFAEGMLWFGPLLWFSLTPGALLILLLPAVALGAYFRRARTPTLLSLVVVASLSVAIGMFAWSVLGFYGGVDLTVL